MTRVYVCVIERNNKTSNPAGVEQSDLIAPTPRVQDNFLEVIKAIIINKQNHHMMT